jgi:hypothetical protein
MDDGDEARRRRAEKRRGWPVRKYALGSAPEQDLSSFTPGERAAMVWQLCAAERVNEFETPSYVVY